jgi:UDP-glucose 4-epimerase
MTRRVLVTGGAGYVGSVVVEQLLVAGAEVVVLDDLSRGHRAAVSPGASFIQGGIGDAHVLRRAFAAGPFTAVVHLAAYALVAESVAQPALYVANNLTAGRALLEAAVGARVPRFVFSSSCAVYGVPAKTPIDENTPLRPINPYGETKRDFEALLAERARRDRIESVSLRYFNAAGATEQYGEDHDPETHLIPNVLAVALARRPALEVFGSDYPTADGTAVRDYVHVADIADAHLRALDATVDGAEAVNLGTGQGASVREVVRVAADVTGQAIPTAARARRPGDPPVLVAAAGRAERLLGWRPRHSSMRDILATAWRWHQAHPGGYTEQTSGGRG